MDVRQLRYFLAVVDVGGFTKAAASCNVAQPSLSQSIGRLERELGALLFHRIGTGAVLTAAGEALVQSARQVLRDVETAEASVAAVVGLDGGHLDIAAVPTLATDPVAKEIARFRDRYPDVVVRLTSSENEVSVVSMITGGECELGVVELPASAPRLVVHEVACHEIVAVCAKTLWPARSRRARLEELSDLPLITTPPGTSTRDLIERAFAEVGSTPTIGVETSAREAIIPLLRSGAGAAFFPRSIARQISREHTVVISIEPKIERRVGLVHRDGPLSPAAMAFVAIARDIASTGLTSSR